jgi:hypothetical protein
MNNWHTEFMAEYHRQQILEDVEHVHLERTVLKARAYRPGLFERSMFRFANWMIVTGKELRKRYEVPAAQCNHQKESFAQ